MEANHVQGCAVLPYLDYSSMLFASCLQQYLIMRYVICHLLLCHAFTALQSQALAFQLSQYRSQAAAKIQSLADRPSLEPAARQELEELTLVLQAALAQVRLPSTVHLEGCCHQGSLP
jgi:hypothetical protein